MKCLSQVYKYGLFEIRRPKWFAEFVGTRSDVQRTVTQVSIQEESLVFLLAEFMNRDIQHQLPWEPTADEWAIALPGLCGLEEGYCY